MKEIKTCGNCAHMSTGTYGPYCRTYCRNKSAWQPMQPPKTDYTSYSNSMWRIPRIKKVLFRYPATIVFWDDNTKTVVKCSENDTFDPEKGLAMAMAKKFFGNEGNYYNEFKKWLPEEEKMVIKPVPSITVQEAMKRLAEAFNVLEGE